MTIQKNQIQLDANESVFFARQLESIKTKTYDVKQKQLKAFTLIPIATDADAGAEQITYRSFTQIGMAKFGSDYMTDSPRAGVYGTEVKRTVHAVRDHYGYSIQEIRRAAMTGTDLVAREAIAARRAIDEKVNTVALLGDTSTNLPGFLNNPNVTAYTVPNDGTGTVKTWSAKTPDQIIRDIGGLVNAVVVATNGRELPDTLLLPITQYNHIANTPRSTNSDTSILAYILKNNPYLKSVEWVSELAGAGSGATDRMLCYVKDEDHLTLEIPQPFEQFPPQQRNLAFIVECHERTAGTILYYPASVAVGDGI